VAPRLLLVEDDFLLGMLMGDWLGESAASYWASRQCRARAGYDRARGRGGWTARCSTLPCARMATAMRCRCPDPARIPFAFVTGHGVGGLAPRHRQTPILTKPFQLDELQNIVGLLVRRRAS